MSKRFFVESSIEGARAELIGSEAHHLIHVMRADVGDEVVLLDGSGAEFSAIVAQIGRSSVELQVGQRHDIDRELPFSLTLGVALPKGDRQRWLVEKAVELGVGRLVPLKTARAIAQPNRAALARLHRSVIEASKQCGRNRLMEISEPLSWVEYVKASAQWAEQQDGLRLLAHPGGVAATEAILAGLRCVQLAIGPEGGFDDLELALATSAGWQAVDLGPRILRIETAALALAALVTMR